MAKRLHNKILSALCTHKLGLQMEGGRHTCTHHTLTVSLLLTQTHFGHVQTDSADTLFGDTPPPHHTHTHCRRQAGPSVA